MVRKNFVWTQNDTNLVKEYIKNELYFPSGMRIIVVEKSNILTFSSIYKELFQKLRAIHSNNSIFSIDKFKSKVFRECSTMEENFPNEYNKHENKRTPEETAKILRNQDISNQINKKLAEKYRNERHKRKREEKKNCELQQKLKRRRN